MRDNNFEMFALFLFMSIFVRQVDRHVPDDIIDFINQCAVMEEPLLAIFYNLFIIFNHAFKVIEKLINNFHFADINFRLLPRQVFLVYFHRQLI